MTPSFISHPDFVGLSPLPVFHKEHKKIPYSHSADLQNKHILYRRRATFGGFSRAILRITADDFYKLYINGRYVTEGPAPGYPHAYYVNEIDVTDHLVEGENVFAVHTYYQGLRNRVWVSGDLRQMLYCSLSLDGEVVLVSDESWKCAYHTGYTACGRIGYDTAFAECYDSASPEDKFFEKDFDDSKWDLAKVNTTGGWSLIPQTSEQIAVYPMLPETCKRTERGLRLTFPTEAVGVLTAQARGNRGDTVILRYGEELSADGSPRYEMRCNCRYEEKWILSGGEDILRQFDYKAFRYAELIFPDSVEISDVSMTVRHYPYQKRREYATDNENLRKVLNLCENTVKYGTQEQFIDCPTREKGAYLGDMMVSGRAQAILTGDTTLLKQVAENFGRTSFICPGLMAVTGCSHMQEIADYSLEYPALIAWIYSVDGDLDFLRRAEPWATGVYEYFRQFERLDGLLEKVTDKWNLVDWPAGLRDGYDFPLTNPVGEGLHNVINALWYGLKLAIGEIYGILGKSADVGAEKTRSAFVKTFYRAETGLFADSAESDHASVHSQIFPLLFGIGCEDEALKRRLVEIIAAKKLASMGVYMAYFALAALKQAGEGALCEALATDEGAWVNMLREGASVTFEAWGIEQKWNTSLFHPWAVAPIVVFCDRVRVY
ncbi:MAG: family 78 glycoside hydrolase catalytic domain [Clostridia bacterium]|nr:family 78 glycoside hydrolase catalytic domain [Clostridia bacterium]